MKSNVTLHKETRRLFVSVLLPDNVQNYLQKVVLFLQKIPGLVAKYPLPEHRHVTLKFIGELEDDLVPKIDVVLKSIQVPAFSVRVNGFGMFPEHGYRLNIIYVELISPELVALARLIDDLLEPYIARDQRPFQPHITIARVKSVRDKRVVAQALEAYPLQTLVFPVDQFILNESELFPEGPVHTQIAQYLLCGGDR